MTKKAKNIIIGFSFDIIIFLIIFLLNWLYLILFDPIEVKSIYKYIYLLYFVAIVIMMIVLSFQKKKNIAFGVGTGLFFLATVLIIVSNFYYQWFAEFFLV